VVNAAVPSAWRERRIRAAGASIAAFEAGSDASDAPVVLLLHGLGHWSDGAWGRLVPQLDPALRYVAIDLPGFGASDKPDVRYDRAYFRRVVDDAAGALELKRFALAGHSLGGFIAADWAGANPERVTHLALIAPAAFARTSRHVIYALIASRAPRGLVMLRPSRGFIARTLRRAVADPAALDPGHLDRAYELAQDLSLRKALAGVYAAAAQAFAESRDVHAGFGRYTGPVFCAWGKNDRYIPAAALRDVLRIYPHATTLVLERTGHLPMVEEPERLGKALRNFLTRERAG
jgi:pimeloyl-ACP methyl ester carboxylesterase